MKGSNSKETDKTLVTLSESDSDLSDLVPMLRKKKVKRWHRSSGKNKVKDSNCPCCKKSNMKLISLSLAAILFVFWLICLSWFASVLHMETQRMAASLKSGKW